MPLLTAPSRARVGAAPLLTPQIGGSKARKLYLAGFRTKEEIQDASDEQLLQIPGIGKGMLKKIRGCAIQQDC